MYVKEVHNQINNSNDTTQIQEDDVMTLINTLMANTKVEGIDSTTGDPFWVKAEMIYLQALFYYVIRHYDKRHQNFTTILELIRKSNPDSTGISELDKLFKDWESKEPEAVRSKTI